MGKKTKVKTIAKIAGGIAIAGGLAAIAYKRKQMWDIKNIYEDAYRESRGDIPYVRDSWPKYNFQ